MIWQSDHQVRHIYLTDKHSPNLKPSWFRRVDRPLRGAHAGLDTIGWNTRTFVDPYQTPPASSSTSSSVSRDEGASSCKPTFTSRIRALPRHRGTRPILAARGAREWENDVPLTELSSSAARRPLHEIVCARKSGPYFGGSNQIPQAANPTSDAIWQRVNNPSTHQGGPRPAPPAARRPRRRGKRFMPPLTRTDDIATWTAREARSPLANLFLHLPWQRK